MAENRAVSSRHGVNQHALPKVRPAGGKYSFVMVPTPWPKAGPAKSSVNAMVAYYGQDRVFLQKVVARCACKQLNESACKEEESSSPIS